MKSLYFYTPNQIASALSQMSSSAELPQRYLGNCTSNLVPIEHPIKNSFNWSSTIEGSDFWCLVSLMFDAAVREGYTKINEGEIESQEINQIVDTLPGKIGSLVADDFMSSKFILEVYYEYTSQISSEIDEYLDSLKL